MCINDFEHDNAVLNLADGVGHGADTSPNEAEMPEIGVSSNYARTGMGEGNEGRRGTPTETGHAPSLQGEKKWFVMRAVYGQTVKAVALLRSLVPHLTDADIYCPTYEHVERKEGKLVKERRPYVQGLFFVRICLADAFGAVRSGLNQLGRCLDFYRDHTQEANWNGVHPPMTVTDTALSNFRIVADAACGDVFPTDITSFNLKPGAHVKVTQGPFAGAEGLVCRIKGKQRVLVSLQGLVMVASAYIPNYALETVDL